MNELQILAALEQHYSLYIDQLENEMQIKADYQALRMQLQRMKKAGYIFITIVPTAGVQHAVYSITKKGVQRIDDEVAKMKQFLAKR